MEKLFENQGENYNKSLGLWLNRMVFVEKIEKNKATSETGGKEQNLFEKKQSLRVELEEKKKIVSKTKEELGIKGGIENTKELIKTVDQEILKNIETGKNLGKLFELRNSLTSNRTKIETEISKKINEEWKSIDFEETGKVNINEIKTVIDKNITERRGRWNETMNSDFKDNDRNKKLLSIQLKVNLIVSSFTEAKGKGYQEIITERKEINNEAKRNLSEHWETAKEALERKTTIEKKESYKVAKNTFETTVNSIISVSSKPEYTILKKKPGEKYADAYRTRESKQLFLAITANETSNFNESFPLKGFDGNYKENIKKYPYIYSQWLKEEGGDKGYSKDQENLLQEKEQNIEEELRGKMVKLNGEKLKDQNWKEKYLN